MEWEGSTQQSEPAGYPSVLRISPGVAKHEENCPLRRCSESTTRRTSRDRSADAPCTNSCAWISPIRGEHQFHFGPTDTRTCNRRSLRCSKTMKRMASGVRPQRRHAKASIHFRPFHETTHKELFPANKSRSSQGTVYLRDGVPTVLESAEYDSAGLRRRK